MGFFDRIKEGLRKTKESTSQNLNAVFATFRSVDEDLLEELEDALVLCDIGAYTAAEAVEELRKQAKLQKLQSREEVVECLSGILANKMTPNNGLQLHGKPAVILVVGVNGVGKTTTIGKLGQKLTAEGKKVLFAAGDTFRAAAADQLGIWAGRCGADIVRHAEGADPAAVIFDAITAGKARGADVIICDTAGRLHNKANLMAELAKLRKIIDRELPDAALETLLVLDATTGQNGLIQARTFKETAGLTGIVLTKLDGTAKGGIVVAIAKELGIPVKLAGVGEGIDDLKPFDAKSYVEAII